MRWWLLVIAFLCGSGLVLLLGLRRGPGGDAQGEPPPSPAPPGVSGLPPPKPAAEYKPPANRSPEMQAFDKAVLFLSEQQQADGHWSAAKSGASGEFAGPNGDIAVTALATYTLLCTAQGKQQNPDAVARAKRGVEWLLLRKKPDGCVADLAAPGQPVVAQFFATLAFLQSATMSTRPVLREAGVSAARHGILNMSAAAGGFGAAPGASAASADVTALGTVVFRAALMEDVKFVAAGQPDEKKAPKLDTQIENGFRAGLKTLFCNPAEMPGVYGMNSAELKPDWDATVAGTQAQVLMLAPASDLAASVKYIFKPYDAAAKDYPQLKQQLHWGKNGEGYRALTLWQGTMAVVYLYGENSKEWRGWTSAANPILLDHQSPDGSWPVAGQDAQRGRVWRASLHALTLLLIAPPPPPTMPPLDDTQPPGTSAPGQ